MEAVKLIRNLRNTIVLFSGLMTAFVVQAADWELDDKASSLSFISIKKGNIAEVHTFSKLEGDISSKGNVTLTIPLASVNTNIAIRDERMQKMLFDVTNFPTATFQAKLNMKEVLKIKPSHAKVMTVDGTINLHGESQATQVELLVARLDDDKLLVSNSKLLVINAGDFKLTEGVEKLREIAKLPSISTAVPISFNLLFEK